VISHEGKEGHTHQQILGVKHAESSEVIANGIIIEAGALLSQMEGKPHSALPLNPPENFPLKKKRNEYESRQLDNVLHHQPGRKTRKFLSTVSNK